MVFLTQHFDYQHFSVYFKINLVIFFFLKLIQEIVYNFKCPVALFMYGEFKKNTDPRYLAHLAQKEKIKNRKHKFVKDPFHNKEERKKQLAKAQAEFEAKRAIQAEKLKK